MPLSQMLQTLSPTLRDFVFQKIANLEDHQLLKLTRAFEPFPASSKKAKNDEDEDWFILPQSLAKLGGPRSKAVAEGLRMYTWQQIVFEETRSRGLSKPEFWTKDEISECRPKFLRTLNRFNDAPIDADEFFTNEFLSLTEDTEPPEVCQLKEQYYDAHQNDQFNEQELEDDENEEVDLSCIDEPLNNEEPQEIPLSNEEIEERLYGSSEEED